MIKKILILCFMAFQLQAIDTFQAVEVNDKLAVRQWLKSKPDVHILNVQGQSLLHIAVQTGNRLLVKQLLKKKIDVNLIDQLGKTALDYAVELQYKNICYDLLCHKAAVSKLDNTLVIQNMFKQNRFYSWLGKFILTNVFGLSFAVGGLIIAVIVLSGGGFLGLHLLWAPMVLIIANLGVFGPCIAVGTGFYIGGWRSQLSENVALIH